MAFLCFFCVVETRDVGIFPATIVRLVKFICLPIPKRFAALAADCSRLYNYVFEAFNCFSPYWCYFSALLL